MPDYLAPKNLQVLVDFGVFNQNPLTVVLGANLTNRQNLVHH